MEPTVAHHNNSSLLSPMQSLNEMQVVKWSVRWIVKRSRIMKSWKFVKVSFCPVLYQTKSRWYYFEFLSYIFLFLDTENFSLNSLPIPSLFSKPNLPSFTHSELKANLKWTFNLFILLCFTLPNSNWLSGSRVKKNSIKTMKYYKLEQNKL